MRIQIWSRLAPMCTLVTMTRWWPICGHFCHTWLHIFWTWDCAKTLAVYTHTQFALLWMALITDYRAVAFHCHRLCLALFQKLKLKAKFPKSWLEKPCLMVLGVTRHWRHRLRANLIWKPGGDIETNLAKPPPPPKDWPICIYLSKNALDLFIVMFASDTPLV